MMGLIKDALSLLIVLVIRLISPLVIVRIVRLPNHRIGHLVVETEIYLQQKRLGEHQGTVDIFIPWSHVDVNDALNQIVRRQIHYYPFFHRVEHLLKRTGNMQRHLHSISLKRPSRLNVILDSGPTRLAFSDIERSRGEQNLRLMGIPSGAKWICIYARDDKYLSQVHAYKNWSYHDYRNSDIETYRDASMALIERGYYVVRIGKVVEKPLGIDHPQFIDYAVHYQDDLMDLYLCAHCHFFLGDVAGIAHVARVFKRPVVHVNAIPFNSSLEILGEFDLILPKRLKQNGELLSLSNLIISPVGSYTRTEEYLNDNIEIINASPSDILETALEMDIQISQGEPTKKSVAHSEFLLRCEKELGIKISGKLANVAVPYI